jgi:hypothetical protein
MENRVVAAADALVEEGLVAGFSVTQPYPPCQRGT